MGRWSKFAPVAGLLLFGLLYSCVYLSLPSRWWFEDDPGLYAYTTTVHNPVAIFTDPEVLRHITGGSALVPMQVLSYWVDLRVAGISPAFAYAHQVVSFLLTLVFLYLFLAKWMPATAAALVVAAWALLPSTEVVLQFLGTRHYLEGLLFSAMALYLLDGLEWWALAAAGLAMLCKEVYAPVLLPILLVVAWKRRSAGLGMGTLGLAAGYFVYRSWILGVGLHYGDMPFLDSVQYFRFLTKLPYTIASNYGGYLLCAVLLGLIVYGIRSRSLSGWAAGGFVALVAVSLLVVSPVSYPLFFTIRTPDPWYRIVFVLNTIAILFGGWLLAGLRDWRLRTVLSLVVFAALVPGAAKTRGLWMEMESSAAREGRFYLSNPDKVLLSEQEAWWFIPGIHWLYGVKEPHYVLLKSTAAKPVAEGTVVWRYRGEQFVPEAVKGPLR